MTAITAGFSAPTELAAGLVRTDDLPSDRVIALAQTTDELRGRLHSTTVWQSGDLPPELRDGLAYGKDIVRWAPSEDVTPDEAGLLAAAWSDALPSLDRGMRRYLRLRVDGPQDVRRLRVIGEVDGLMIVPSLDTRAPMRPLVWRWPFRVGVVAGVHADAWLATLRDTEHYGSVFDAEPFDANASYDIAIVNGDDLSTLDVDLTGPLGRSSCVIVAAAGPEVARLEDRLDELESMIGPSIAVAVSAPPDVWWRTFFHELSHDVPIDAAVECIVRYQGVDALLAGPRFGMDITAPAHWFAAVAPDFPELAPSLLSYAGWDWQSEGGGSSEESQLVRAVRAGGGDPVAVVSPPALAAVPPDGFEVGAGDETIFEKTPLPAEPDFGALPGAQAPSAPAPAADIEDERHAPPPVDEGVKPRRLVARALDGDLVLKSVLPPRKELRLLVRVAIPELDDIAADTAAPPLPGGTGPTVELDVVVRGDVWEQPPRPQKISISRVQTEQPSTWAVFGFSTPDEGGVVSIEIWLLHHGKPLQSATYVSSVRALAVPGERPTITTFALSGPDEPEDEPLSVDVTLDGRGAELVRIDGSRAKVLITGVQDMLDTIEDRVSRVLGVPGAPDSFQDAAAAELLITLAGIGTELGTFLAPLELEQAQRVNIVVNSGTRVLPLELVYAGPPPDNTAQLCDHVAHPPPPGQACTKISPKRVCPYAFWGLHRSVARTIQWEDSTQEPIPWPATLSTSSVLYAATVIADDGATKPLPTTSVLEAARGLFTDVIRVTSWRAWRSAIKNNKPNVLVVLGHTMVEGGGTNLYIGKKSILGRLRISTRELRTDDSPRPLVLLIACATAAAGDAFGSLPGALTAKGAGAVVGTLSKIVGPQGATATTHLLQAVHDLAGTKATVGDAVAAARRSLVAEQRPIGLILVSHGEVDTKLVV